MRCRSIVLAMALGAASWGAHAQPIQGIYLRAGAGARTVLPTKNSTLAPGIAGHFDINQALGYDAQLSVGYALGNGWRFEIEGTYGRSSVKNTSGTSFPAVAAGAIRNFGVMANALFDLDIGSPYVYPYLGLGAGYQSTRLDGFVMTRTDRSFFYAASGSAGGFAAQAMLGLSFPIPNVPGLSITLDYRMINILGGQKFNAVTSFGAGTTKFHNQFDQSTMLGVRYAFNTPPPAASAQAAQAPAVPSQSYQVVFDGDKAGLTEHARAVVKDAALASTTGRNTRIAVTGNAEITGNAPFDRPLSERRAKAIAVALIGDGVPEDAISILALRTANRAGQPGSRRIEIVTE